MSRCRRLVTAILPCGLVAASTVFAGPAAAGPSNLTCGSEVTQSVTLNGDIGPCLGNGLIIKANHITVNLGGHRVIGTFAVTGNAPPSNTAEAIGIDFRRVQGSTVKNGEVTHFALGVRLKGGAQNQVNRLNVHDNIGRGDNGDGIALFGSDRNLINNNEIVHNGIWDGIGLLSLDGSTGTNGSSYNEIRNNVIKNNNIPMLDDQGRPSWKRDIGVAIEGPGSTHNVVDGNTVAGSGTTGIQVFPDCIKSYNGFADGCAGTIPNEYNVISNNTVRNNGFGAPVATAPLGDGILVLSMGPAPITKPGHTTIEGNTVTGNQRNGIGLGGGNGEDLFNSPGTTGGENYGCSNTDSDGGNTGVPTSALCGTQYNTVRNNTSKGNGEEGIWIGPSSNDNVITNNNVAGNRKDGIAVGLAVQYNSSSQAVFDSNGNPVTIPGTAGRHNTITLNHGSGNHRWDGRDDNPRCDRNDWSRNQLVTVNQPCVR